MTSRLNRALQQRGYIVAAAEERCSIGDVWHNWSFCGEFGESPLVVIGEATRQEAAEFAALYGTNPPPDLEMNYYRVTTE